MSFLTEFFANLGTIGIAISLLLSLLSCFFGYKLMKLWIAFAGFVIGFVLGDVVCALLRVESFGVFFLIGAIVGVALGILSFRFYKVGIFLLGTVLGGLVSVLVLGIEVWWRVALAALLALAIGALTVLASKLLVILFTAISGGLSAAQLAGVLFVLSAVTPNAQTIVLVAGIVLAAVGVVVQFMSNPRTSTSP